MIYSYEKSASTSTCNIVTTRYLFLFSLACTHYFLRVTHFIFKTALRSGKLSLFYRSGNQGTEKNSNFPMATRSVSGAVIPRNLTPHSVLSATTLYSLTHTEHESQLPCGPHHQNADPAQQECPKVGFIQLEQGRTRYSRETYQSQLCSYISHAWAFIYINLDDLCKIPAKWKLPMLVEVETAGSNSLATTTHLCLWCSQD